jgi:hypothetical protein
MFISQRTQPKSRNDMTREELLSDLAYFEEMNLDGYSKNELVEMLVESYIDRVSKNAPDDIRDEHRDVSADFLADVDLAFEDDATVIPPLDEIL